MPKRKTRLTSKKGVKADGRRKTKKPPQEATSEETRSVADNPERSGMASADAVAVFETLSPPSKRPRIDDGAEEVDLIEEELVAGTSTMRLTENGTPKPVDQGPYQPGLLGDEGAVGSSEMRPQPTAIRDDVVSSPPIQPYLQPQVVVQEFGGLSGTDDSSDDDESRLERRKRVTDNSQRANVDDGDLNIRQVAERENVVEIQQNHLTHDDEDVRAMSVEAIEVVSDNVDDPTNPTNIHRPMIAIGEIVPAHQRDPMDLEEGAEIAPADMVPILEDHYWQQYQRLVEIEAEERERYAAGVRIRRELAQNDVPHLLPTYLGGTVREVDEFRVGEMVGICPHCGAKYFALEMNTQRQYTRCCYNNKVVLDAPLDFPEEMIRLYTGQHELSGEFKKKVLQYNCSFQFASIHANLPQIPGRGPYVYVAQGKFMHHYADVNVNEPNPRFGTLYFIDPDYAVNARMTNNQYQIHRELVDMLTRILAEVNPYAEAYRHLRTVYDRQVNDEGIRIPEVVLEFVGQRRDRNNREFDLPMVNEVAAVYNADPDNHDFNLRFSVFCRNERTPLRSVDKHSEHTDPLCYPLLFPRGDRGWHPNMPLNGHRGGRNARVTLCNYYAYRLAFRDGLFQIHRYGGKLTQQYIVDAYIKVQDNNLTYLRHNQNRVRAEEYVGLADYLHNVAEQRDIPLGRRVILPSTFQDSPRQKQQRFQDAMKIVSVHGPPTLFSTMTCNPKWPEIVQNIPPNDLANNHPMLVARIFKLKLNEFVKDIRERHLFGIVDAQVHVIEFQKRGLPHAHILTIMRPQDRIHDASMIDHLVSAEIPDFMNEPLLYELVRTHMVHGPCGDLNPNSPCMANGECTKNFPKRYSNLTVLSPNGHITYKRRQTDRRVTVVRMNREYTVDNAWIVPYNPYSLCKYRCHINSEICVGTGCVKYLYKYIFKNDDHARMRVNADVERRRDDGALDHNEIEMFVTGRYMTPPEAAWRLNQFPTHESTHTVYRLKVHLPGRQMVRFVEGMEAEAFDAADRRNSELTAWFLLNQNDVHARQFLYEQIPHQYVWNSSDSIWTRRKQRFDSVIARMYNISIRYRELYFLRLLLLHVRGPTSFEDVRNVNGVLCPTFEEACRTRGLLADDVEWVRSLEEAARMQMPTQMIKMFAYILVFGEVANARALWDRFHESFTEGYRRHGDEEHVAVQKVLRKVQFILRLNGSRLSVFGIPEPEPFDVADDDEENRRPIFHHYDNERAEAENMIANLNDGQRRVFDAVMNAVGNDQEPDRLFYMSGPGGSGKTHVYNTIIGMLRANDVPFVSVAWTGLAASLLIEGKTAHSTFKLPLCMNETSTSAIKPTSPEGQHMATVKVIIWDEISMATKTAFRIVDEMLRDVCRNDRPFGGKVVLVGGDFRQILPVVINGGQNEIVAACVKSSPTWHRFRSLRLEGNFRVAEDPGFVQWLEHLGNGELENLRTYNGSSESGKLIQIPEPCIVSNLDELIRTCYGERMRIQEVPNAAILTPRNAECAMINQLVVEKLEGQIRSYTSADSIAGETTNPDLQEANYPMEFLNSLTPSGMPPHALHLKVGAIVMLLRNLDVRSGLCNGTKLRVTALGDNVIKAEIIHRIGIRDDDRTVLIPRADMTSANDPSIPFVLKRRQFPLALAYCLTINKAQGQTLDTLGLFLPISVFSHGQLYVAFSRAKMMERVHVLVSNVGNQGKLLRDSAAVFTKNIVYREVLDP